MLTQTNNTMPTTATITTVHGYPTVSEKLATSKHYAHITDFFKLPEEKDLLDSVIAQVRGKNFVLVSEGSSRIQVWRRECELNPIKDARERDRVITV